MSTVLDVLTLWVLLSIVLTILWSLYRRNTR